VASVIASVSVHGIFVIALLGRFDEAVPALTGDFIAAEAVAPVQIEEISVITLFPCIHHTVSAVGGEIR